VRSLPRPRTYDDDVVIQAAMEAFWRNGFDGSAIADLEDETGLYRSSLYHAFGSKRGLFAAAVDRYITAFVDPLLVGIEHGSPSLRTVASYFFSLSELFLGDRRLARRGCLLVNTLAETRERPDAPALLAARLSDRLRRAFVRCLSAAAAEGHIPRATVERRADMLSAGVIGIWLIARADPAAAARRCDQIGTEIGSWRHRPPRA
jgi:AcrR family transcriptional regulator